MYCFLSHTCCAHFQNVTILVRLDGIFIF
jgi:hypothetical protein